MKQITKLSMMGLLLGISFGVLTSIRYFLLYPDTDKALVYGLMALMILALSWCHEEIVKLRNTITSIEDYLAK